MCVFFFFFFQACLKTEFFEHNLKVLADKSTHTSCQLQMWSFGYPAVSFILKQTDMNALQKLSWQGHCRLLVWVAVGEGSRLWTCGCLTEGLACNYTCVRGVCPWGELVPEPVCPPRPLLPLYPCHKSKGQLPAAHYLCNYLILQPCFISKTAWASVPSPVLSQTDPAWAGPLILRPVFNTDVYNHVFNWYLNELLAWPLYIYFNMEICLYRRRVVQIYIYFYTTIFWL